MSPHVCRKMRLQNCLWDFLLWNNSWQTKIHLGTIKDAVNVVHDPLQKSDSRNKIHPVKHKYLNLSTWFSLDHVDWDIIWKHYTLVEKVCYSFSTFAAGSKRRQDEEEQSSQKSQWPCNEDENKEPHDCPQPLECHVWESTACGMCGGGGG